MKKSQPNFAENDPRDPYQQYMQKSSSRSLLDQKNDQMMQEQDPQAYQNKLVAANELAKTASGGQSNAATGVLGGAAAGAAFGPYGAAVGAGVGLVGSLAQMRAAKKQREREATAGMYNREAQQIQRTNEQNISVMSNMLSALRTAFTV
jgi:hypothetical protein